MEIIFMNTENFKTNESQKHTNLFLTCHKD